MREYLLTFSFIYFSKYIGFEFLHMVHVICYIILIFVYFKPLVHAEINEKYTMCLLKI